MYSAIKNLLCPSLRHSWHTYSTDMVQPGQKQKDMSVSELYKPNGQI